MSWLWLLLAPSLAWGQPARTAGGVVRSDEWRVMRNPEKQEEFIGNVRYRSGASVMNGDWALYKHLPQTWQVKGNVKISHKLESGETLDALGDQGFMEQRTRAGWLRADDRVVLKRTPVEGQPDHARAKQAEWQGREVSVLTGLVHLWGPRLEAWADRAQYTQATSALLLTGGRPVVRKFPGWDAKDEFSGAVKGDEVRAWRAEKKMSADGNVSGWLEFKKD